MVGLLIFSGGFSAGMMVFTGGFLLIEWDLGCQLSLELKASFLLMMVVLLASVVGWMVVLLASVVGLVL